MGHITDTAASVFDREARRQLDALGERASSAAVARTLGLSRSYWHRLCTGDRPASTRAVERWAKAWASGGHAEIVIHIDRLGVAANIGTAGPGAP